MGHGYRLGLISREQYDRLEEKRVKIQEVTQRITRRKLYPTPRVNGVLSRLGTAPLQEVAPMAQVLRRPEVRFADLLLMDEGMGPEEPEVTYQVEVQLKYQGYIERQFQEVERFKRLEAKRIPGDVDYDAIPGLSNEVREKLRAVRPTSVGQASRISGMTPAAISILLVYLERLRHRSRAVSPLRTALRTED
jgi:tRNA uridine 5-carboxymethylaminomethyl modification enzyme